jgi:hypothetical protein
LTNSFKQHIVLFNGWQQWKADGSLHDNDFSTNILRKECQPPLYAQTQGFPAERYFDDGVIDQIKTKT